MGVLDFIFKKKKQSKPSQTLMFSYINKYRDSVTKYNAKQAIADFDEDWRSIGLCLVKKMDDYGRALLIYSDSVYKLSDTSEKDVQKLSDMISYYCEGDKSLQNPYYTKYQLYLNLGKCWHKLGVKYDSLALLAIKKYLYNFLSSCQSFRISFKPTAYAFRPCSKYLLQSLCNETLNLSSPTLFNDPFDCPILEFLNNDDEISKLIRLAYCQCMKIACFSSNIELPIPIKDKNGFPTLLLIKKHPNDPPDFLNELMWSHYADSHRGICIKYSFPNQISELGHNRKEVFSFFRDITYSDENLIQLSKRDSIDSHNSFFLKGKQWEYENELRFFRFDINGKEGHDCIKIGNCIDAVYFGLKCPIEDENTIKNILKNKHIQFFKMEIDQKHFGQIKAVPR